MLAEYVHLSAFCQVFKDWLLSPRQLLALQDRNRSHGSIY
jgi:hypothetical protein